MRVFTEDPIDVNNTLYAKDYKDYNYVNYNRIMKHYLPYIQYKTAQSIKMADKKRRLDKRFSIEEQQRSLLFELDRGETDFLESVIKHNVPGVSSIKTSLSISTVSSLPTPENTIIGKSLLKVDFLMKMVQPDMEPSHPRYSKEIKIELGFYINIEGPSLV